MYRSRNTFIFYDHLTLQHDGGWTGKDDQSHPAGGRAGRGGRDQCQGRVDEKKNVSKCKSREISQQFRGFKQKFCNFPRGTEIYAG